MLGLSSINLSRNSILLLALLSALSARIKIILSGFYTGLVSIKRVNCSCSTVENNHSTVKIRRVHFLSRYSDTRESWYDVLAVRMRHGVFCTCKIDMRMPVFFFMEATVSQQVCTNCVVIIFSKKIKE